MVNLAPDDLRAFEDVIRRAGPGEFEDLLGQRGPPEEEDPLAPLGSLDPAFGQPREVAEQPSASSGLRPDERLQHGPPRPRTPEPGQAEPTGDGDGDTAMDDSAAPDAAVPEPAVPDATVPEPTAPDTPVSDATPAGTSPARRRIRKKRPRSESEEAEDEAAKRLEVERDAMLTSYLAEAKAGTPLGKGPWHRTQSPRRRESGRHRKAMKMDTVD